MEIKQAYEFPSDNDELSIESHPSNPPGLPPLQEDTDTQEVPSSYPSGGSGSIVPINPTGNIVPTRVRCDEPINLSDFDALINEGRQLIAKIPRHLEIVNQFDKFDRLKNIITKHGSLCPSTSDMEISDKKTIRANQQWFRDQQMRMRSLLLAPERVCSDTKKKTKMQLAHINDDVVLKNVFFLMEN